MPEQDEARVLARQLAKRRSAVTGAGDYDALG